MHKFTAIKTAFTELEALQGKHKNNAENCFKDRYKPHSEMLGTFLGKIDIKHLNIRNSIK